jgi:hypothetical protein
MNRWIIQAVDWYVQKYHSKDFIHRDMIQSEIEKRIASAEARVHSIRDRQEQERLDAKSLDFDIIEAGYKAEIFRLEKIVADACEMRSKVEDLYFKVKRRAQDLALITAENQEVGTKIVNEIAASVGRIDILSRGSKGLMEEIEGSKQLDYDALRIK